MMHAIRRKVVVLPGGRIEIVSSELTPGAHAEVIVLEEASRRGQGPLERRSATSAGPAGPRKEAGPVLDKPSETEAKARQNLLRRQAFMKLTIQERRRILAEQAERMADHYEQDAEVRDLGGGDFLD